VDNRTNERNSKTLDNFNTDKSIINTQGKIPNICPNCWNFIESCHKSIFEEQFLSRERVKDTHYFINTIFLYLSVLEEIYDKDHIKKLNELKEDKKDKINEIYYFHFGINGKNVCNMSYNEVTKYLGKVIDSCDTFFDMEQVEDSTTKTKYI
jgi:hypothetical protein